jgi:hypothetical protein
MQMKNLERYKNMIGTWDESRHGYFQVDHCDDEIFYSKRPEARFRNSRNRSAWHNNKNRVIRQKESKISQDILKNQSILAKLYPESFGVNSIASSRLDTLGFSNEAHYRLDKNENTNGRIFCYGSYGVEKTETGLVIIHKKSIS